MSFVDQSVKKVKAVALEQSQKSEANVQSTALEQQQFVKIVSERVDHFKTLLIAVSLSIIVVALLLSISTTVTINRSLRRMTDHDRFNCRNRGFYKDHRNQEQR